MVSFKVLGYKCLLDAVLFVKFNRKQLEMDYHSLIVAFRIEFETACWNSRFRCFWVRILFRSQFWCRISWSQVVHHYFEIRRMLCFGTPTNWATSLNVWSWAKPLTINHTSFCHYGTSFYLSILSHYYSTSQWLSHSTLLFFYHKASIEVHFTTRLRYNAICIGKTNHCALPCNDD